MKRLDIILWGSVLRFSLYGLSLLFAQVFSRNTTIALSFVNTTTLHAASREASCFSSYGTQMNLNSCKNAWNKMPRDRELYHYGMRKKIATHLDVGLPVRYLSDNGLCAIDIRAQLALGDSAKPIEVSEAAKSVLDHCVLAKHKGGSITGFSQRGLLMVLITKYEPTAVCESDSQDIPFIPFCERVLRTMPAARQTEVFAFTEDHPRSRYFALPQGFSFRMSKILARSISLQ